MALLHWLKRKPEAPETPKIIYPQPVLQGLPDPNQESNPTVAKRIAASNKQVASDLCQSLLKKPRGPNQHHIYSDKFRTNVARFALRKSSHKASIEFKIPITTVKTWRGVLLKQLKKTGSSSDFLSATVTSRTKGRPTKLPADFDESVKQYLSKMQASGGSVSWKTVVSVGRGLIESEQPSLLKKHGGHLELNRAWAASLLRRMNFVKRKATKTAAKVPLDFPEKKSNFLFSVCAKVRQHSIPSSLVVNWDQTGISMVPASNYSLAPKGARDIAVFGQDDKRQITVGVTCCVTGELLPFQVIYEGITDRCLPQVKFPGSWNVTQTASHWR